MDDVIISTSWRLLRWRPEAIEVVPDAADLPIVRLGSEVECRVGATTLATKMSKPKDFKRQHGTVVVVHLERDQEDRPRRLELGVQLDRGGIGWFVPAELTLIDSAQEVPHAS